MTGDERHAEILRLLAAHGRVSVNELAPRLDVTVETVRRDLAALDRAGALRKVHGGAVPVPVRAVPESTVTDREELAAPAKQAIAAAALAALDLQPGASVLLDAGTTVAALARLLPAELGLTVITSSVLTAAALASREDLTVRVLGGQVRGITQATVGPEALSLLSRLRVDLAVLGANGISEHGASTPDASEAAVKQMIARAARRTLLLADSSKFGQEHLVTFARLEEIDLLVTDAVPPAPLAAALAAADTEVLTA